MQTRRQSKKEADPESVKVDVPAAPTKKRTKRTSEEVETDRLLAVAKKLVAEGKRLAAREEAIARAAEMEQNLRDDSKKDRQEAARPTPKPRKKASIEEVILEKGNGGIGERFKQADDKFQANFGRQPVPVTPISNIRRGRGRAVAHDGIVARGKVVASGEAARRVEGVVTDEKGGVADGEGSSRARGCVTI